MAEEFLRGRERRYFGYMGDCRNKIDTPESARSFRSVLSHAPRKVQWRYESVKSFKPDPPGQTRFADKIIHLAVKTQIPGLLPALKNSPQFEEFAENPIFFRSPEFEQHKERSLHYFWLPRQERTELCGILQSHFKTGDKRKGGKRFVPGGKRTQLTGLAAETAILDQQEYLDSIAKDPRIFNNKIKSQQRRRLSEVPSRMLRMNRKFQTAYWDPTFSKHLTDPFRRLRGKLPACDAVCHEHFQTGTPELPDLLACLNEYQRRYEETQDLSGEQIELEARREHLRRLSLFGTLEDEERRRGVKHIKELTDYDKESEVLWTKQAKLMISAAEYLNKIKIGRRFPTPPREIRESDRRSRKGGDGGAESDTDSINVEEYLQQHRGEKGVVGGHQNPHRQKWRKRRHFHHNYNTEEFYMEMYLHFLNPEEDLSSKAPPKQMTDVKELRRKMNLDEDPEKEKKLIDLMNESSVEALHAHGGGRKSHFHPHQQHPTLPLTPLDIEQEKEMLEHHLERLNNPRLKHVLSRMISQISLTSSSLDKSSSSGSKKKSGEEEVSGEGGEVQTTTEVASLRPGSSVAISVKKSSRPEKIEDDDELDEMGDIPEHELRLIMSDIASSKGSGSTDNLSSGSSGGEEEEMEGEDGDDDALKLFKTARRKKDSVAEFMDLTTEFRARICQGGDEAKSTTALNPFAEAVCVLYPDGSAGKSKSKKLKKPASKVPNSLLSVATIDKRTS